MKVIFLDFDGVITIPETRWHISLPHIKRIKEICDATGAKIVVSSSWRMDTIEETIDKMIGRPKRCPRNRMLNWFIDNLYDVTPWFCDDKYNGTGRGGEIQTWLDAHPEVDNYVIIDDDGDMLDEQLFNFVQTDWAFGIQDREVKLAIDVLNNIPPRNSLSLNNELQFKFWVSLGNGKVDNYKEIVEKYNPWKNEDK